MNILLIHRYFAPDTPPYAWMLQAIAERLAADGHTVTVLTSQPSYSPAANIPKQARVETRDGYSIMRARLLPETKKNFVARGLNLLLFMAKILTHVVRKRRYDVVMAATTPPVFVAMAARVAAKLTNAKFVYHCQDLHPELTLYSGLLKEGWLYRLLRRIDYKTVTSASRVVVLSQDMAETLRARGNDPLNNIRVINNFLLTDADGTDLQRGASVNERFRILFAGNLGYFQGLEIVIEAARLLDNPHIDIVFLGDGAAKARLIDDAGDLVERRIYFHGHVPQEQAEQHMREADACLITLGKGIIKTAYPSKTITYLSQGCPLLVVVEEDSELASLVTNERLGLVSAPDDAPGLARNMQQLYEQRATLPAISQRAYSKSAQLFGRRVKMKQWSELMAEIESQPD